MEKKESGLEKRKLGRRWVLTVRPCSGAGTWGGDGATFSPATAASGSPGRPGVTTGASTSCLEPRTKLSLPARDPCREWAWASCFGCSWATLPLAVLCMSWPRSWVTDLGQSHSRLPPGLPNDSRVKRKRKEARPSLGRTRPVSRLYLASGHFQVCVLGDNTVSRRLREGQSRPRCRGPWQLD